MMLKQLSESLSGLRITLFGGLFLLASLVLMLLKIHVPMALDPAWATVFISGFPLVYAAVYKLVRLRQISSALLVSIAMIASIAIGELFAAGEVAFIMAIGGILEDRTVERAKRGLKKIIGLAPRQGRLLVGGTHDSQEEMVAVERIGVGDLLRVTPGETIPVDGEVVFGSSSIDQSVMTGESLPVDKQPGDAVFSGTINRFGSIDIRATRVGEDSSLQRLIRMVRDAENNKAPMQRIVDKWASWMVPAALLIAVITYAAMGDIVRAVTVLVVFCPCALVLATPTSIMAAIGQATKYGVIIKSGDALEKMGRVDRIAFDKTGTLTFGRLVVSDVFPFGASVSPHDLLMLAASAEARSEHPLGKAIVQEARDKSVGLQAVEHFSMDPGKGLTAQIGGKQVICGKAGYLEEQGVGVDQAVHAALDRFRNEGKAAVVVSVDSVCIGAIALSDTLRPMAAQMVGLLEKMNTQVTLLTGDHAQTADYFARQAGIGDVRSGLLPSEKVACITQMQQGVHTVCMIGDGVNDAPALKTADVGVAMGAMGSDIAVDAADIALMSDDISRIPYLKRLSNATISTIKFNIVLAMVINVAAIILSVMGLLNPITGALVHNVGSVLVVLNAALLYDRRYT